MRFIISILYACVDLLPKRISLINSKGYIYVAKLLYQKNCRKQSSFSSYYTYIRLRETANSLIRLQGISRRIKIIIGLMRFNEKYAATGSPRGTQNATS